MLVSLKMDSRTTCSISTFSSITVPQYYCLDGLGYSTLADKKWQLKFSNLFEIAALLSRPECRCPEHLDEPLAGKGYLTYS